VVTGWAASILIDADHYGWFAVNKARLDPIAAVRFFNQAEPPEGAHVRMLHSPLTLGIVALLSTRHRALVPVAVGMAAHITLDAFNTSRLKAARLAALRRDGFRCQACGAADATVTAHQWRQRWLLPSYRPRNFIALCGRCHLAAHSTSAEGQKPQAATAVERTA
jgi:hypothetical protein